MMDADLSVAQLHFKLLLNLLNDVLHRDAKITVGEDQQPSPPDRQPRQPHSGWDGRQSLREERLGGAQTYHQRSPLWCEKDREGVNISPGYQPDRHGKMVDREALVGGYQEWAPIQRSEDADHAQAAKQEHPQAHHQGPFAAIRLSGKQDERARRDEDRRQEGSNAGDDEACAVTKIHQGFARMGALGTGIVSLWHTLLAFSQEMLMGYYFYVVRQRLAGYVAIGTAVSQRPLPERVRQCHIISNDSTGNRIKRIQPLPPILSEPYRES